MNTQEILKDQFKTNDFIEKYTNLIYKVIKKEYPSIIGSLDEEDYVQLGRMGIYQAMLEFDETRKVQFKTFAYIIIKREILKKVRCETNKLNQTKKQDVITSLDEVINIDTNETRLDKLQLITENIDDISITNDLIYKINVKLSPKESLIFKLILKDEKYQDIGNILGVSKQRVGQVVNKIRSITKEEIDNIQNTKIKKAKRKTKVKCVNTNEVFETIKQASNYYNTYTESIISCCKGKRNFSGKHPITNEPLQWEYYNKVG
jgi:RNA polymerase sporulation-specific sigma factor